MKFIEQVRSDETEDGDAPRLACVKAPFRVSRVQNITPHNHKARGKRKADFETDES